MQTLSGFWFRCRKHKNIAKTSTIRAEQATGKGMFQCAGTPSAGWLNHGPRTDGLWHKSCTGQTGLASLDVLPKCCLLSYDLQTCLDDAKAPRVTAYRPWGSRGLCGPHFSVAQTPVGAIGPRRDSKLGPLGSGFAT